jgi:hypothetical protein
MCTMLPTIVPGSRGFPCCFPTDASQHSTQQLAACHILSIASSTNHPTI